MNGIPNQFASIEQVTGTYLNNSIQKSSQYNDSFQNILEAKQKEKTNAVKFSKHAHERLQNRQIELSKEQMERLNSGVGQAREKNIKESLVMVDNISFIVNIKNNTVVTAMNEKEQNIFTNIDGVVIS